VPGEDVLLTSINLPTRNKKRILSAVPYAIEDQVAEDIDNLHFAIGDRDRAGNIQVAVVSHERMYDWTDALAAAGIEADKIVPDNLAIPYVDEHWTLLLENRKALLRTDSASGLIADIDNLFVMLSLLVARTGDTPPAGLRVLDCRAEGAPLLDLDVPVEQDIQALHEPAISAMAAVANDSDGLNLLQGQYSKSEQFGKLWRPWRAAAAMLAGWMVLHVALLGLENSALKAKADALRQQVSDVYLQTFPEASRVVNAQVQMQRKLEELRGGGGSGGTGFVALLSQVGKYLNETSGLVLDRMTFRAGEIVVAFTIGDLQQLDSLKQRLTDEAGVAVQIQSATSRSGKVEARLQIKAQTT
jgi:general secretion pathway protein L